MLSADRKEENKMEIGIIGGGASGMAAAIAAAENGAKVTILEKNDRIGKKILATGNGKCNLSNLELSAAYYRSDDPEQIPPIMEQFTLDDTLKLFHRLGLMTKDKNGYLYPECEQASAVLDVLRFALDNLAVNVCTSCRVRRLERAGQGFLVHTQKDDGHFVYEFDRIILACGSLAGLKNPADENGLQMAAQLGLQRIPFSPALTALRCKEDFFKALAGVRSSAEVSLYIGKSCYQEIGEVQLTDYGISGIPVFQLSRYAAKALPAQKELLCNIDFLPHITDLDWKELLLERRQLLGKENAEQFFTGTVHKKLIGVILKRAGISMQTCIHELPVKRLLQAAELCKHFPVTVTAANSFTQAQVCAGGIRLTEVTAQLEAKKQKGLFLTGELLDVDGRCGGYNLQWAWTTGTIAGRAASLGERDRA